MIVTNIADIFNSTAAYIYLWVSKSSKTVYVGQTAGDGGVIARAGAHVKAAGTLRSRYYNAYGDRIEAATDWKLLSYRLPKDKKYTGAESSYRNAVEYLVQTRLNESRVTFNPPFRLISNVTYSDHCGNVAVIAWAKSIVSDFCRNYQDL